MLTAARILILVALVVAVTIFVLQFTGTCVPWPLLFIAPYLLLIASWLNNAALLKTNAKLLETIHKLLNK